MYHRNIAIIMYIVVVMALVAVVFAGCAGPTAQPAPSPAPSPTAAPKPTPAPTVAGQPKPGGVLRYLDDGEPAGWDPQRQIIYSPSFTQPIFSNLVQFDPTKREVTPQNIIGDLAEKWDTGPDGKTYTFYLRKGVKWHDGRPFTAKDIVDNLNKLVDPKNSAMASQLPAYQKSEAVDDFTVKVYLSRSQPSLLAILATGYCPIVPTFLNVDWKSTNFLVGTGPFKLKKYTSGIGAELERNPDYFGKDQAGNRLPYLDGITINIIKDMSAQVDALVTKRVDMLKPSVGTSDKNSLDRITQQAPQATVVWGTMGPSFIYFNFTRKPLDDVRVRRALTMVTDMKALSVGAYGMEEFRDQSVTLFAAPFGLTVADKNRMLGWDKPIEDRIATAKKLLAEAGYASGFKVVAITSNLAAYVRLQTVMADQWSKLGINMEIVPLARADLTARQATGDYDIVFSSPSINANDPDEAAGGFVTKSSQNYGRYSNAQFDKLRDDQSVATDLNSRMKLTQEMERIFLTDLPAIPLGAGAFPTAYSPWVKGFVKQNAYYTSYLRMERVWLDESLRK